MVKKILLGLLAVANIVVLIGFVSVENKVRAEVPKENLVVVRAPEQTISMEHPDFQKEEYISVLPEGKNIAPDGKITSDGFQDTYTERKAIDGKTEGVSYWEGASDIYPNNLTVTFDSLHHIHAVRLALNPATIWGERTQSFSVLYSNAEGEMITLIEKADYIFTPDEGNEVILTFDSIEASAVTVCFTGNTHAKGAQVAEIEIYEK